MIVCVCVCERKEGENIRLTDMVSSSLVLTAISAWACTAATDMANGPTDTSQYARECGKTS